MSKPFVIVGAARTGSTLLVKTLNSLDGICCHGELLANMVRGYEDGFDPVTASQGARQARADLLLQQRKQNPIQFILQALQSQHAATGFKALYSSLSDPRWSAVTGALLNIEDITFIHLTRHNSLRRFVSEQIMQAGGPNHSAAGGNSEKSLKVHIDIDTFLRNAAQLEAQRKHTVALLNDKALLDISYEQLAANTATTVARVCQFLGLSRVAADIQPALTKVGAADLGNSVSNYQELLDNPVTRDLALQP